MKQHGLWIVLMLIAGTGGAAAQAAGSFAGTATTTGGRADFCKGKTSITASVAGGSITIVSPLAAGGSINAVGAIDGSGRFTAVQGNFSYAGTLKGKRASGEWKGTSCFGTFTLSGR